MITHLQALRADFERQPGRLLSLPIAGAIVWAVAGIAAASLPTGRRLPSLDRAPARETLPIQASD